MNRIDKTLALIRANNKKMLSPYITAGDPHPEMTVELMHKLVECGADVLELGIPFSDPMAEGPVIQKAMERALAHGVTTKDVLAMVGEFRQKDKSTPIILMGYVNPIEQYGYERFANDAATIGVDGTILVDLAPEESEEVAKIWEKHNLYGIYLCSPTTSVERMQLINRYAKGYLYYVSLKGVTGADALDTSALITQYQQRKKQTHMPLMVGFGIKTPEAAAEVASFADGVIVGAALITAVQSDVQSNGTSDKAGELIRAMRRSIDSFGMK